MRKLEYRVTFNTPAFLGNAQQAGQWRTPPFKALLRQWWRVAYAAQQGVGVDVENMRHDEGLLFGVASDVHAVSRKSQVRIRLDCWSRGKLTSWDRLERPAVFHEEVKKTNCKVGPHAYLGFGPLDARGGTKLSDKCRAAIQAGETALLSIACPNEREMLIAQAFQLTHRFGTVGGRSRNAWGSFDLLPANDEMPALEVALDRSVMQPWRDALDHDWPHAIGTDSSGPLIWQTHTFRDWKEAMRDLAKIKIGLRTQFKFTTGNNTPSPQERHWLSYPVTRHSVQGWRNFRLPNSLRFKVRNDGNKGLRGVIFHVPCLPPEQFRPNRSTIVAVWERVHGFLDDPAQHLSRIPL